MIRNAARKTGETSNTLELMWSCQLWEGEEYATNSRETFLSSTLWRVLKLLI